MNYYGQRIISLLMSIALLVTVLPTGAVCAETHFHEPSAIGTTQESTQSSIEESTNWLGVQAESETSNAQYAMYRGKTISVLGDSISTYDGVSNNTNVNATLAGSAVYYSTGSMERTDTWWQQVVDALDMELLVNNSWSGSCILHTRANTVGAYIDRCVQLHNDQTGEEPNVILVFMGTNDFSYYQSKLGTAEIDYDTLIIPQDDGTFEYAEPVTSCEAYAIMLHKMQNRYPDAEIYCMTLMHRRAEDYPGDYITDVGQPTAFNGELGRIAKHFGVHVVDMESCGITSEPGVFDTYMGDKRVHPNQLGMDKMSEAVIRALTEELPLCTVTAELAHVRLVNESPRILRNGGSYSADIEVGFGYTGLQVQVTMGGQDITESCYANGAIQIVGITGDVVITAKAPTKVPQEYRWEFEDGKLVSTGETENALTKLDGAVSGTVFSNTRYQLAGEVLLQHDLPWVLEWKGSGNGGFMLSEASSAPEAPFFFRRAGNFLNAFGSYNGSNYDNYGIALNATDIDGAKEHAYRLENRIADDGSNMVWLLVDGIEIGPMINYFDGGTSKGTTAYWINGKDFKFNYIGTPSHPLTNYSLEYLRVWEGGEPAEPLPLRYDDHYDVSGKAVEIVNAGMPTSYQVGYGVEENAVLDTAVVTLEGNTLVATGIGTAKVRIDDQLYEVTVEAAPISLLLLIGQSNMEGNEGDANQSIVCPDGMVYATYGDRYDMNITNATHYAPSALTGQYREINTVGGTDGLSDYPVYMLTDEGNGRKGPDSGFAYEWVQQTGEKIWIVNASHGGTSLNVWQPGTTQYEECQAMFGACTETLCKEIAAGHFTLSHMAYFWCQGCNDRTQTAEWYVDKYLTMHESIKTELAFDHDSDSTTADKTFEFGGIIPVRAGNAAACYRDGVNSDVNPYAYHESFADLRMSGPRVAQYWMGNNPELADIWNVCTIGEDWVWMPDGTNGVTDYFQTRYENGTVDYTTQVTQRESWYTPTTPAAVHDSIHYNQIGYNEVGRESVRNALICMGINEDYAEDTTVTFVNWTGYQETEEISAATTAHSGTLVVPIVSPVTRCKDVTYSLSQGLSWEYYDLIAENAEMAGSLTAAGAQGGVNVVKAEPGVYFEDHLSQLPGELCCGVNLWSALEHDSQYYTVNGWGTHSSGEVYSVTIPVNPGDRIFATSYSKAGQNGHPSANGIRTTFLGEYGVVRTMAPADTYSEFSKNGYLTVPEGTVAINVPMWTNDDSNELYILNLPHDTDEGICGICGKDTHVHSWGEWYTVSLPIEDALGVQERVCVCGETENREVEGVWQTHELSKYLLALPESYCADSNLWTLLPHTQTYYYSGIYWGTNASADVWSVTIPVEPGDRVFATSFGKAGENGHTSNGIRATFFDAYGVCKTMTPAETYAEFTSNGGYLIAPEGALAINVPMYGDSDGHELYILSAEHIFGKWTQVKAPSCDTEGQDVRTCTSCGATENRDTRITGDSNKILVSTPLTEDYFNSKNILLIGDSITYGVSTTKTYGEYLAESLGAVVTNLGVSGSGYCTGGAMATNKTLTEDNVRNADVVTIMLGVNDWAWAVKEGSWNGNPEYYDESHTYYQLGEFDSTDTSTFYGALHAWCQNINNLKQLDGFEDKRFIVITPLITSWNNSVGQRSWDQDKLNIHGHTFREYCTAIMEVCAYYSIPVFDANMFSGIYYRSADDNNVDVAGGDGVHVNAAGHALLAEALEEFLLEGYSYENRAVADGGHNYVDGVCEKCRLPQPHQHSYESVVTKPTCTEQGYTTHTCTVCGDSYVDDYVGATGHTYSNSFCTVCGKQKNTTATPLDEGILVTATPENYLTISNPATEKLACAPSLVTCGDGEMAVVYLADDVNAVETESSTTIVCRLGLFNLNSPQNGTFLDIAAAGQTIGDVTIGQKAPYEPNLLVLEDGKLLVLFNIRDTSGKYIYYGATVDPENKTVTDYTPLTLDGKTWIPVNIATFYNAIADNSISNSGPAGSMVFTSQIVSHGGYYYGYCGGICSGFSGILVRSADGINWTSVMAPEALPEMAGVIECGFQFIDNYIYFCMRDISSGVYQCSYDFTTGEQLVRTHKLSNLTTSKPTAFTQDGKLYLIVNKATSDDATIGRRNTALFYEVDPETCRLTLIRQIFCADGCAYHSVVNVNGTNYWAFHTDARRINPYTQGRSNLAFQTVPTLYSHNYESVVTASTCTEQGFTTYTCTLCGDSYVDSYVEALGHRYINNICTGCGKEKSGILNLTDYSSMYASGCITVAANIWQAGVVNYHYQIPLSDFTDYNQVTVTANSTNKSYIAFFTQRMTEAGAIAYADGWTEVLIMNPGTTQVLTIPADAQYMYILNNNAAGDSMLPESVVFSCIHTYKNGICTLCGAQQHPTLANWSGKVISILSASTSTFAGYIPVADGFNLAHRARYPQDNLLTDVNETWWMQLITRLDAKLGINDSWAGSQVLNTLVANSGDLGPDAAMASMTRIQNLGANGSPDVILFFGAGNDMGRGVPLGSFDSATAPTTVDLTTTKWETLADAYVAAIMRLQHAYPDAQIVAVTTYAMPSYATAAKLDKYIPVLKAICDHYGVPTVDLRDSGVTFDMLPDNIHPNAEGMDLITEAVLNKLLNDIPVESGENVVYSVSHELNNAVASLGYYKGVSAGEAFTETLTGNDLIATVTMGGVDITADVYKDGKIAIPEVTGNIVITAKAAFNADGHLQQLPKEICAGTNLWTVLEPENIYYTATGWGNTAAGTTWSATFPVKVSDRIWATSLGAYPGNGSTANGVRVTWFDENGVLKTVSRDVVYSEFAANGYLTAPEGAVALNLPMTGNEPNYAIYLLDRAHDYESVVTAPTCTEKGYTTHTCDCGDSYVDSYVDAKGHNEETIPAVVPTCTSTGLTEGSKCNVCGKVLIAQMEVSANGHAEVIDEAVAPTCTSTGLTEGKHCNICGTVTVTQEVIPAKGHTEEAIPGMSATCGKEGKTEGSRCSVCTYVMKGQETIPATGKHVYDDDVDGTCNVCGIHREMTERRTVMHMFRMYDPNSGEHFYTGSIEERENLVAAGWNYEGVGFTFSMTTGAPVYRLYDRHNTYEHLYTMDEAEKDMLISQGWELEGVAFNSAYDTEVPQYRLHNPNETRGAYHFTASAEERDNLIAAGWEYQGIGFYSSWK